MSTMDKYKKGIEDLTNDINTTKSERVKEMLKSKLKRLKEQVKELEKERKIISFNTEFEKKNLLVYGIKEGLERD